MNHLHITLNANLEAFTFHVDLRSEGSSLLGVFGHSAAGKTLLLRSIAGFENKILGRIEINGAIWQDSDCGIFLPTHQRAVGYVFQEPRLLPHLTAKNNICFAMRHNKGVKLRENYDDILQILKLTDCLGRYPHQLSGGEQQRVAIARAVLSNPDILLMDEPISALDMGLKDDIIVMIKQLAKNLELSVVYVSHDYSEIIKLADYVTLVKKGTFSPITRIDKIRS